VEGAKHRAGHVPFTVALPLLGSCTPSVGVNAAFKVLAPAELAKLNVSDAQPPGTLQLVGLTLAPPGAVSATVPAGVVAPAPDVSVTVTEQLTSEFFGAEAGQVTVVFVARFTFRLAGPMLPW
jgi:hypothetical protein